MSDNHNNYDHSHGGDRDSQSMNPEQGNNKGMSRINDKSQGNSGTVSPRNQDRHQQVSTNSSLSSGVNISSGAGVVPYHYSVNASSAQQGGHVPEFVPRGASGMHYDGQGQGQGQGLPQSQGQGQGPQGGLGPGQQGQGAGQGQGYPQQPQHYQPYVAYPPNQVIGYGQQPHHPYHPQMVSGVRQLPTQQLQQQPHYQPHPGVVQGHEMNMMHPQQQQQLQQQQQQQQQQHHATTRNRVEERGGGGGADNYQNYNNNNARNMPVTMPAYAPNGIPISYRGNMSASISDYPYDATYGANPIVNQVGGYYTAVPVQGVMMSTGSVPGSGDVPVLVPIASNTTLENMTNERLMALAKSNEQHKVVSEMLLKTAQSDLANSRKKIEELTAQLDEVRRELTAEKALNESRKIVEYEIAAVSGSLGQTDLSTNSKEMAYATEKQEERLIASSNLQREWERDVDEGTGTKPVYAKKDMNNEKEKSTPARPTDSAATILVKSVLLSPHSSVVASNAELAKIPAASQRMWADVDDEEEDEAKAPATVQGQGQRAQGGVYSRGPGQGHGEGPSRGGGSTDGSSYKSGRDKESTGQYGAGRGSKAGQPYNSYDGDRNRGFDRDNRESSYGSDHHSSFGGRGSGEGRGQFGGRGMNNMGGRGQTDRGSVGSGGGNVVRPLRPTKIIPPTGGLVPSSPSKPSVEHERDRDGQDTTHGGSIPSIPRPMNGTSTNSNNSNNDSSSSSSGKKLNSNPISDVRNTKSLIFGGPPNPNPSFTRSTTSTFGSRDVRVLDAANAANASANANANSTSSYSNANSNFESPTRRKGPPAQFISTSPDRENSNADSNSRFGDSSDEFGEMADKGGANEEEIGTDESNLKMNNAAMKSKKGIKNLRTAGRDGGRGDGWRGSGVGGRGRGRDDERRSLGSHEGSGGRGEAMKIPPPTYFASYHRDKENDTSANTVQSPGAVTSATESDRDRGESMRSSSAAAGVNMDGAVCRFYSKGFCRFGSDCNNLHTGPVVKSLNRPRADSAPEGEMEADDNPRRRLELDRREKGAQPGRGWSAREGGGRDAGRESKGRGRGGRRPHTTSFDGTSNDVIPPTATDISISDTPVQSSTRSDPPAIVSAMSPVSTSAVENTSVGEVKAMSTVAVAASAVTVAVKETVVISE